MVRRIARQHELCAPQHRELFASFGLCEAVKRIAPILLVVAFVLLVGLWLARRKNESSSPGNGGQAMSASSIPSSEVKVTESFASKVSSQPAPLLGETILREYGNTNLPAENDLTLMSRLMNNSVLLLKSAANRPLSANEDWADLFRGKNSASERFLPDQHIALNMQGQLVDRWDTPLFFHAVGGGRYELRSAGPDKKLWTDDDIHRNTDGSFRHGAD